MTRSWEAERLVDAQLARELIREQFGDIQAKDIELLGVGWDNTAFLVDGKYVFRFPRRSVAVPLIEIETRALSYLAAAALPLAVPLPKWLGKPTDRFDWPFAGYEFLHGQTACIANLSVEERHACARPLAEFLRAVHRNSAEIGRSLGLHEDQLGKLDTMKRLPQIRQFIDRDAARHGLPVSKLTALVEQIERAAPVPVRDSMVHGDFYVRHLLVDAERQLHGVIDWGDAAIDDPAVDLCIVYGFLPASARADFFAEYGDVSENTILLAKLRALSSGCILANYGLETGEEALFREGLYTLTCVVCEL